LMQESEPRPLGSGAVGQITKVPLPNGRGSDASKLDKQRTRRCLDGLRLAHGPVLFRDMLSIV
jgi:hypothetical protein